MSSSSYANIVQELYVTYFGRPADAQGLQNFEAAMAAANAPTDVATLTAAYSTNPAVQKLVDGFGTSPESVLLYGQVTTSASSATSFVTAVFENLLNRAPAAAGLNFWVDAITSGSVSLGNAALSIAAGATANTSAQGLIDAATIANKLNVAGQFTAGVSDTSGIAEYSGPAAALVARSLLSGVTGASAVQSYQTEVAQAVAALGAQSTNNTFALTTGQDTLAGGLGSNTFNAMLDNSAGTAAGLPAATLTAGDAITPAGNDNILNITDFGLGAAMSLPQTTISGITVLNVQSAESIGTMDFSTWSGLQSVNIGLSHGSDNITVAPTQTLSVRDTGTAGAVTTYGGSQVSVFSDANHAVSVNGGSTTKSVSVSGGSNIVVHDLNYGSSAANTIATVAIANPTGGVKVNSNALTALTVAGDNGQNVTAAASVALTAPLNLTLDGDSAMTLSAPNVLGLNVTAANDDSSGIILSAPQAGALSFSGNAGLTVASLNTPGVITASISGSGNFSADFSKIGSHANINATQAGGTVSVVIGGSQSFSGGKGADNVTIGSASATATAGSASNNSINFSGLTFTPSTNLTNYANFQSWELSGTSSGTLDMKSAGPCNNLIVSGAGGNISFIDLHPDTPLAFIASDSHTVALSFSSAEASGAVQDVTLGTASTAGIGVGGITISGYASAGATTLDLSSNSTSGQANTLGALADTALATLNISGNAPLSVGSTMVESVAALTINDSVASGTSAFAGLSDNALATLTLNSYAMTFGSISTSVASFTLKANSAGSVSIGSLADNQLTTATIADTSTSTSTVNTIALGASTLPALQSLTLNGHISANVGGVTTVTGITLAGAADDAPVTFNSTGGTQAGATDAITLGNGNDSITLGQGQSGSNQNVSLGTGIDSVTTSSIGNVNITFAAQGTNADSVTSSGTNATLHVTAGAGNNKITVSGLNDNVTLNLGGGSNAVTLASGAAGSVAFGTHTGTDNLSIGTIGALTNFNNILSVSGLNNAGSDSITFSDSAGSAASLTQVTAGNVTASGGSTGSLADWIAAALGKGGVVAQTAHGLEWFQFGGNTYLIETSTAMDSGRFSIGDGVVELTGTAYTFAHATFSGGVLHLLG
ncbi:MAG TPA: DUF4214 domain-containing protein [Burkholderiaceae bacterium]